MECEVTHLAQQNGSIDDFTGNCELRGKAKDPRSDDLTPFLVLLFLFGCSDPIGSGRWKVVDPVKALAQGMGWVFLGVQVEVDQDDPLVDSKVD